MNSLLRTKDNSKGCLISKAAICRSIMLGSLYTEIRHLLEMKNVFYTFVWFGRVLHITLYHVYETIS